MRSFDEKYLLDDDNLAAYTGKYKDKNPISQLIVNNFYHSLNQIVVHMNLGEDARLLEVGCGAGISSLRIKNMLNGQHFEISDNEDSVMQLFNRVNFPIKFSKESVTQLERKDRDFTCVFMLEVLEHVQEYRTALKEIFRVSDEYVVISTPSEPLWRLLNILRGKYISNYGNTPGHINHWSSGSLTKLISQYGEVVKVLKPTPWTIVLAKRLARK